MVGMIKRLNRWRAALLLAAAALALAAGPFHGSDAQEPARPAPPTGVSATDITVTATEARVTLTWNPVDNAASYGVWRSGAGAVYTTGTSYTFTGLYPHRTYNLSVWTRTADGATGSHAGTQVTMPARPGVPQTAAPTNMTLSNVTASSVTVSWSGVAGATAYQIARSGVGRITLAGTARSHTFTGLTAGRGYSVWLWAIGHGGISNNVRRGFNALPPAPSGLSTTATASSITLSWTAVTGASGYEVKRSPGSETPTTVAGASYTFNDLTADTAYTLSVRARNGSGTSEWSNVAKTTDPAAPSNLSATATSTSITLSWDAVTGATSYDVKLGTTETAAPSGTSHTFPNLTANTAYTLSVRARNSSGASPWSSLSPTTAPAAPHVKPGILALWAGRSPTATELNWTNSTGATHHEVKLGPDGEVETASGDDGYYGWHYFTGLVPNVQYTFYVRAANSWGASEWVGRTAPGTVAPPAPSGLEVTESATTSLRLSWTAARPSDTTTYEVKLNSGGAVTAADRINGHTFSGLTAGTAYTLYVRATDGGRPSAWSQVAKTTVPAAPGDLGVTATSTSLTLSWTAVTGAASYDVKRSPGSETPTTATGTSYTFPNLTAGTTYTLFVRARNGSGTSTWSEVAKTTIPAAPGDSDLTATATNNSITLSWTAVTGAASYDVKRSPGSETPTTVTDTSYTFPNLTAGTAYTLSVRAKNDSGTSAWSSTSTATTGLAAPTGLSVTTTPNIPGLTLGWDSVIGATSYQVWLGDAGGAVRTVQSGTSYTFSQPSLRGWFEYTFYVRAKNNDQTSPWGLITISGSRGGRIGDRHAIATSTSIAVCCLGLPGTTTTKYKLGASGAVATVPAGGPYTFTGLAPATVYTLHIDGDVRTLSEGHVHNPEGPPQLRRWSSWTTVMTAPRAPTDLRATPTSTGLTLSWTAVPGATRYDVRLGIAGSVLETEPGDYAVTSALESVAGPAMTVPSGSTSYTFTGLTASTEYRLYVHARNSGGSSEWRSITATTASTLPPPSGLSVTGGNTLSWDAVAGATSYEVKRGAGGTTTTVPSGSTSYTFPGAFPGGSSVDTFYVRGKNSTTTFPWRSITAKIGGGLNYLPLIRDVTSSSITFRLWRGPSAPWPNEFKLGVNGAVSPGAGDTSFTGLAADTEYTLYGRSRGGTEALPWRPIITVKTRPRVQSGVSAFATSNDAVLLRPSRNGVMSATNYTVRFATSDNFSVQWASGALRLPRAGYYLSAGTEYTVYVRPAGSAATADWTTIATTTAPARPHLLSATATSASLTLRWDFVPGATGYRVKLGETGAATTVTGTSHTFTGLTADTEYTLYIFAKNRGGNSVWNSITARTVPLSTTGG